MSIVKDLNVDDLKRVITMQHRELMVKNERLKGVQDLTRICSELEEKRAHWQTKAENLETGLSKAEARIAYLQKKLGIGPQSAFKIDVVNPGISKKDFNRITQENMKLREALDHIVATGLGGDKIALKNKELYEMVIRLQDEISQLNYQINELQSILNGKDNELMIKVNDLLMEKIRIERSMNAKQYFAEKLLKENERLKGLGKKIASRELDDDDDVVDGKEDVRNVTHEEEKRVDEDVLNARVEKMTREIREKDELIRSRDDKIVEIETKLQDSLKKSEHLEEELKKANERKEKSEEELNNVSKRCADLQKKCTGFFNQVVSLNSKQQESEEEISSLKRKIESQRVQEQDNEAMLIMMRDSIKNHEHDFRRENEEKIQLRKKNETLQKENEVLKRENQSHMNTARRFERETEKVNSLLQEERMRSKPTASFPTAFGLPLGAGMNSFQNLTSPGIVVADSARNESNNLRHDGNSTTADSSSTLIECPYCSRHYPYHLIESHVQDCMEDSLYSND